MSGGAGASAARRLRAEVVEARLSGSVSGLLYERAVVSVIPLIRGYVGLRLIGMMYEGFSVGQNARCWGSPSVLMAPGSRIDIGDEFWAVSDRRRAGIAQNSPVKLRTMRDARVIIGDRVQLNGTSITCRKEVTIGSGSLIAANVAIVDADFHQQFPADTRAHQADEGMSVRIGENVWIGMGSLVLKGVSIGANTIIGAGSVVTRAIPEGVVAAGNPARVVRALAP